MTYDPLQQFADQVVSVMNDGIAHGLAPLQVGSITMAAVFQFAIDFHEGDKALALFDLRVGVEKLGRKIEGKLMN